MDEERMKPGQGVTINASNYRPPLADITQQLTPNPEPIRNA